MGAYTQPRRQHLGFAPGRYAIAICDGCGFKKPYLELQPHPVTFLRFCDDCGVDAADRILPAALSDRIGLRYPNPDVPFSVAPPPPPPPPPPGSPISASDLASTVVNQAVIINVLANDVPADSALDVTSVLIVAQPTHGAAVANVDGTVTYTPATGYVGQDSFTYTVADLDGDVGSQTICGITVAPQPPPSSGLTFEDGTPFTFEDGSPMTFEGS